MANRAQPFNSSALAQMGVPPLESGLDGSGIAIGFVDYGFDALHPCLRDPRSGRTRFHCLLDQNTGNEFTPADLDDLIDSAERYGGREFADRSYDPHANYFGCRGVLGGAHGTLMASIAAGSAIAGFRGVAPAAQLIGVQLGLLDHHWREEDANGSPSWTTWRRENEPVWQGWKSYDEAPQILAALDYIHERACDLNVGGLVIGLSIGAYAGAHDGRSAVERKISEIVERGADGDGPHCVVVVAAGNAGVEDGHFSGEVAGHRPLDFEWRMQKEDATQNKLEIWYRSPEPVEIALGLCDDNNARLIDLPVYPGPTHPIHLGGARIGVADHVPNARAPLSRARILLHPPLFPREIWPASGELAFQIRCKLRNCNFRVQVHAWLERDDGPANCSTLYPSDPTSTLSSLACAKGAVVVTAHDHHRANDPVGVFPASSLGPAPWDDTPGTAAPLCSAPGHRIWGARSKSQGFIETSGTSAAAALATGLMALRMQREPQVASLQIEHARASTGAWSPRLGYGPLSLDQCSRR
jgi:subtilisin family serine protease